jgi:DNA repair protein RadC
MKVYEYKVHRTVIKERKAVYAIDSLSVYKTMRKYFSKLDREHFVVLYVDAKNRIIGREIVSVGTLTSSIVHPREVFKGAILSSAASIILCHNHPSGVITPSKEDIQITNKLVKVGNLLEIKVLDHLILGDDRCYSIPFEKEVYGDS